MKLYSVYDPEFKPYGQVVTGMDEAVDEILSVLKQTPQPEGVGYVPEWPAMQQLPAAAAVSAHLYGGLPVQLGWCNGHNTKLNCLEYHRCSEFNLGTEDFILLLARQEEIENGTLDTGKVKAFRVPAGAMVECYATSLHRSRQGIPGTHCFAPGNQHRHAPDLHPVSRGPSAQCPQ